jgi:hypothetical protein
MGTSAVDAISAYIAAHRDGAHYEFAAADPTEVASLIIHDRQPILSLTSYGAHELLPITRLAALVASGQLQFAVLNGGCGSRASRQTAACSPGAAWVRSHGTDVSAVARLPHRHVLYRLGTR